MDKISPKELFLRSAKNIQKLADDSQFYLNFEATISAVLSAYKRKGALFVAGNGGSAADAQHIVAEFVSKLERNRTPIRAFSLTVNTSTVTAAANDYGYEYIFERQIRGLMTSADIFMAISTSGNSENILRALKACREIGIPSILLTGRDGGKAVAEGLADITLIAPGQTTAQIQEAHVVFYHTFCSEIEQGLVDLGLCKYL